MIEKKDIKNKHKNHDTDTIVVRGARTHNLKNITVEMPRNSMIAITGLSGSGKSSLAFDTIFAEGQRRYVESLSAYARQFLRQMQKPDVDEISGLSPAISIDQKSHSSNPRSTVATITEIYDYLRVLYARIGVPHCLVCGRAIKKLSNEEIMNTVLDTIASTELSAAGKKMPSTREAEPAVARRAFDNKAVLGVPYSDLKVRIFAPLVVGRKGEYYQLLYDLLAKGYLWVRVDGTMKKLRDQIILSKTKKHDIDVLVDEIFLTEFKEDNQSARERLREALERALHESDGLLRLAFPTVDANGGQSADERLISAKFMCPYDSFSYPEIEPRLFSFNSPYGACSACNGLGTKYFYGSEPCDDCNGARLRKEALNIVLGGNPDVSVLPIGVGESGREEKNKKDRGISIVDLTKLSIAGAQQFFADLNLTKRDREISKVLLREIESRLQFMANVGIEYLTLDRRANTLSGGEAQRIRLASQLGSRLVGALYVLDEPTIGLHPRDNDKLVSTLHDLRNIGNTIIVVEHDEDTIYSSDYLIDIGPGAGVHGGRVVASGWLDGLLTAKNPPASSTLAYLRGEKKIAVPVERRMKDKGMLRIQGATIFNIKNMNVDVPLGRFVAVTGVSGSGKSSFVYEILYKNLRARFERRYRSAETYNAGVFTGSEYLSRAILIDQSPIGRTPRSNPATYTGAFNHIRDLFASTEEARARGWKPGRFSFNVPGGRCEVCQGNGLIAVEMHFLPTVYVTCDICGGKRFEKETLEVKYKKKSIYDVLEMTVEEAIAFFEDIPAIYDRIKTLAEVGLGYLTLGQGATTLSGGESQRVKISSELYRPQIARTIYILDEPTVGLHYDDVAKLIEILQRLVDRGNSVLVIEHNLDVIKNADYVIDIGPEGGVGGGRVVAKGTPEDVAENPHSHTGTYLKKALRKGY